MPVTPTIEVDDTLKERSSHGSRRISGYIPVLHEAVSLPGLPVTGYSDSKDENAFSEKSDSDF